MSEADKPIPFEEAMARLEEIVAALEEGDLELERSLALFEEGVGLARRLETRLAAAEMRVEELLRDAHGAERTVPLELDGDDEGLP